MTDEEIRHLQETLIDLGQLLVELDIRIGDDSDDARRSLVEALRAFNELARILDPHLIVLLDEKDEK